MIVIKLIGGLGNQLFQFAFGKAMSLQLQEQVKYDVSVLLDRKTAVSYTLRDYELSAFNAKIELADLSDIRLFKKTNSDILSKVLYKIRNKVFRPQLICETNPFIYDKSVFTHNSNVYFDGYWQNELYFNYYKTQIREDLTLKKPLYGANLDLAYLIEETPISVSLHVRRGDYVSNIQASKMHGICSIDYYEKAVKLLQKQLGEIQLFVFSDEPEWVKNNMRFKVPLTYVSHNTGKASVEDLRLMSLCKHNIIANSSFSWWGAWLNANQDKLVIAPNQWFTGYPNSNNIIPDSWIKL